MMKRIFALLIFLIVSQSTSGQIRDFFESNESSIVSDFFSEHAYSIRTDYVLESNGAAFGRNNQDFFSFKEGQVFLLKSGYFVGNRRLVEPWSNDKTFDEYRDNPDIAPKIGTIYLQKPGQRSYSVIECDTMFMNGGLSYFKINDTTALKYMNASYLDSVVESDWVYSLRRQQLTDSLRNDTKILNVGGFKKSKAIISACNLGNEVNERTQVRDIFFFRILNNSSVIEFRLLGYLNESSEFHSIERIEDQEQTSDSNVSEDITKSFPVKIKHVDGFALSNKTFIVNEEVYISNEQGIIELQSMDYLEINGYQVEITTNISEVIVAYDDGIFVPIKKIRKR